LPPTAAPLEARDLWYAVAGLFSADRAIAALEEEISRDFGVRHVFLLESGKAALALTLRALRAAQSAPARHQVVVPAYTCFSVPAAVLAAGLSPVVCDIDPATFDFDHAQLETAL
jgi:perosamine synthetase